MVTQQYTCTVCGYSFAVENKPQKCPTCGALSDKFYEGLLSKEELEKIHQDRDEKETWSREYHMPKKFPAKSRHGRTRRFVIYYDDAERIRDFYEDVFGWDIVNLKAIPEVDEKYPVMYTATGPSNPNWEPRVVSFTNGILMPRKYDATNCEPLMVIEVDNIEEALKNIVAEGGKVVRGKYGEGDSILAIAEDTEENILYLWETPQSVTWEEPESQTL